MLRYIFLIITIFLLASCKNETNNVIESPEEVVDSSGMEVLDTVSDVEIISDYDMSTVPTKDRKEFKENLARIEKKYGEQWDFCTCAVKQDSINRAFQNPSLSDEEFDRLLMRSDFIDEKCQAFMVQNPNVTPEERADHDRKVKECLKEAGVFK